MISPAMHELAVTQNLLRIGLEHAQAQNASKVLRFNIVIGEFASIVDDSVQFYWDIISKNTIAEGAGLSFRRIGALFECTMCKTCFPWREEDTFCPSCGSFEMVIKNGDEFFLESIEIE